MSRCTVHGLNVECGPSSFRILELLSNGTGLPKTCMLAFYCLVSVWKQLFGESDDESDLEGF